MRKDLNKLLCERERVGHRSSFADVRHDKKFNYDDLENSPSRESMKKRYASGWSYKTFNENLNPLYGIVRKNAGRPWDKVFSELCEVFDTRSVINQHILVHLKQFVETNIIVGDDGELYVLQSYGKPERIRDGYTEYYVDPRTNLLVRNKHYQTWKSRSRNRRKNFAPPTQYNLADGNQIHQIDGIWYMVEFADLIPSTRLEITDPETGEVKIEYKTYRFHDVLERSQVAYTQSRPRYAKSKKQLSHQQLKQFDLLNAA